MKMNIGKLKNDVNIALDRCSLIFSRLKISDTWEKETVDGRKEIVTDLDIRIEEFLINELMNEYPYATVLAEETSVNPSAIENELCFVIDPIDGTKELIAGRTGFAVSVAVMHSRKIILGIVDFPARRQRFQAILGNGSTMNGRSLYVRQSDDIHNMRIAVSPSQSKDSRFDLVRNHLDRTKLIPIGALSPKIAAIATGEVDGAFYLPWDNNIAAIWDFAAVGLILEEAGGILIDLEGHNLLQTLPIIHKGGWLAANKNCTHSLISLFFKA